MTIPLSIGIFPCTQVLPLYFGVESGLFEQAGLRVTLPDVSGARNQMERLAVTGEFDLIQTAFDNVLSLSTGAFEDIPPYPTRVVSGGDGAFLTLVGSPEAVRPGGGMRLGVDSPVSGYAFVAFEVLEALGLPEGDYRLVSCGGGRERARTLREGGADVVVSYPPHDGLLVEDGFQVVARAGERMNRPYQGYVIAALDSWLSDNAEAAGAFHNVFPEAMEQCLHSGNRRNSATILARELGLPAAFAQSHLESMLADPHGFDPRASIDPAALEGTIALREKWGGQLLNRSGESFLL